MQLSQEVPMLKTWTKLSLFCVTVAALSGSAYAGADIHIGLTSYGGHHQRQHGHHGHRGNYHHQPRHSYWDHSFGYHRHRPHRVVAVTPLVVTQPVYVAPYTQTSTHNY